MHRNLSRLLLLCVVALGACGGNSGGPSDAPVVRVDAASGGPDARPAGGPDAATGGGPDGSVVDGGAAAVDARIVDAPVVLSLTAIAPEAAARTVATPLLVTGAQIASGASLKLSSCDSSTVYDLSAGATVAADGTSIGASLDALPTREQGLYTITVTNPDGQSDLLLCAFRVVAGTPPTVATVTPSSAYQGAPGDGLLSDELVAIGGAGFQATPVVRWVSADGTHSYDALTVSFISPTEITAVVPAETRQMPVGDYHVVVVNPDLLSGTFGGLFHITAAPPPRITSIDPVRVLNGSSSCTATPIILTGAGFVDGAKAYYLAPPGTACAGSSSDANGFTLCPMAVSAAPDDQTRSVEFTTCPGTGPWPLAIVNPDGQTGTYFSLEVTPSADGHLNQDDFTNTTATLSVARWKHGATYAFDVFGHAFVYVAGGQDADRNVLGSVEWSELDVFGTPGPFTNARQYGGKASPRIDNNLAVAREGHVLLHAGKTLLAIGGTTAASDSTQTVAATKVVESATLLSYDEMPTLQIPTSAGVLGLPAGTWYYRVAAVGPWGESLPSREESVRMNGGVVRVCWKLPPGAGSVNVYRSLGADGRAGSEALLATEVTGACLSDDGQKALAPAPGRLRGGPAAGAGVARTKAYRVSATTAAGETQASYAASIEVTGADVDAGNGAIQLFWDAVPGATGYRVYRDDGDGFVRLDTGALSSTGYTDAGATAASPAAAPRAEIAPLPVGSLSRFTAAPMAQWLGTARDGLEGVVVRLDAPVGNLTGRVIVAGGRSDNHQTAYLTSAESIGVGADGQLVGSWGPETAVFNHARAFFALVTTQDQMVTPFPPPPVEPPCEDRDGDGYIACACAPSGAVCDCNDNDPTIHPGAAEICGDGIDQNCDGTDPPCQITCTTDSDGDGFLAKTCGGADCCDSGSEGSLGCSPTTAKSIHPGAIEICGDGIDQDCDGIDPPCAVTCTTDADHDGHISIACGGDDCCDSGAETALGCNPTTAPGIHPGAIEICGDGIDQDCSGFDRTCKLPGAALTPPPVHLVAVEGADSTTTNVLSGRSDFEACQVDTATGHLACGAKWIEQGDMLESPRSCLGLGALLYFDHLFVFPAALDEGYTGIMASVRDLASSAMARFGVADPPADQLLTDKQSASTKYNVARSHYRLLRLMSYVYAIGGWTDAGPTGSVEQHLQ
jgi:hypothetical protein